MNNVWLTGYNYLIVGNWSSSHNHDEHNWGTYGENILNTDNEETHLRISSIDRQAPTAAWLCKSANDHNWQRLAVTLGMRNVPIRPLNCDHE